MDGGSRTHGEGTGTYTLQDVGMDVASDHPALAAALAHRLQAYAAPRSATPALRFVFRSVAAGTGPTIEPPSGPTRPIYEVPDGQACYAPAADQLYLTYRNRVYVRCAPERGETAFVLGAVEPADLRFASHLLFTLPLIECLKRRGRYSVHAAGVAVNGRALLLAGPSGAGKSTLALALVRAGFCLLGDDMLFLMVGPEGLRVLPFLDEVDVTPDTAAFFPELQPLLEQPPQPGWRKYPLRAETVYPGNAAPNCRPGVLLFPRLTTRITSRIAPMDPTAALLELTPNVLLTAPHATQQHLDVLGRLVRESACYRLETGRDFDTLPALLERLIT